MKYTFECSFNSLNEPTISMTASDKDEVYIIVHYFSKNGKYAERALIGKSGDHFKTNKGFHIPLLNWEFSMRNQITQFMLTTYPNKYAIYLVKNELHKTRPNA